MRRARATVWSAAALDPVRNVHSTARKALGDAKRWKLVAFNAALDADTPTGPRPNPQAWSAEQVRRYLAVAEQDRWTVRAE